MADDEDNIRWGLRRRLEFIEWRAFWNGRVNRKDLEDQFQISTPQASADFARYQSAAPTNIEYDKVEKTYVANRQDFRAKFLQPLSPERYLRQLEALTTDAVKKADTWFDDLPPVDVVPSIARGPEAYTLRAIVEAIRQRASININYLSLTSSGSRDICPHALAFDGFRWHVRALSLAHSEFRDYVLGRILSVSEPRPSVVEPADDVEWHTFTTLQLTAHPNLSDGQRKAVEHDFRIQSGMLEIPMRLALLYYFIRRHNLDLRTGEISPERAQLHLKNYDEVIAALAEAKMRSKANVALRTSG